MAFTDLDLSMHFDDFLNHGFGVKKCFCVVVFVMACH